MRRACVRFHRRGGGVGVSFFKEGVISRLETGGDTEMSKQVPRFHHIFVMAMFAGSGNRRNVPALSCNYPQRPENRGEKEAS